MFLLLFQIDAHQDDASAVTFADEGGVLIYSGGDDGVCKVWDRRCLQERSPRPVGVFSGHKDGITYIDSKVPVLKEKDSLFFSVFSLG